MEKLKHATQDGADCSACGYDIDRSAQRLDLLGIYGLISVVLLILGGWLTSLGLGDWYYQLNFPPYQPPGWLFTPAWMVVLTLLAIATWRVTRTGDSAGRSVGWLYVSQCVLNVAWSFLFFTIHRPDLALIELLVLNIIVFMMIRSYGSIDRVAGRLMIPYFCWLLFATAINGWIVFANPMTSVVG